MNLLQAIAIFLGKLFFWRKSKAIAAPKVFTAKDIMRPLFVVDDEAQRKDEFLTLTGESVDTFEWSKNIFTTWILDQSNNYNNFFQHGLKPIKTEDLQFAKASFEKGLNDINAELASRGL